MRHCGILDMAIREYRVVPCCFLLCTNVISHLFGEQAICWPAYPVAAALQEPETATPGCGLVKTETVVTAAGFEASLVDFSDPNPPFSNLISKH